MAKRLAALRSSIDPAHDALHQGAAPGHGSTHGLYRSFGAADRRSSDLSAATPWEPTHLESGDAREIAGTMCGTPLYIAPEARSFFLPLHPPAPACAPLSGSGFLPRRLTDTAHAPSARSRWSA